MTTLKLIPLALLAAAALEAQPAAPVILSGGTVNAADYTRAVAPGALVCIFGTNLAPSEAVATEVPLPTSLAGISVEIADGNRTRIAPLYYVSPGQINAQLPYDLSGAVQVRVRGAAGLSNADSLTISPTAPSLFTTAIDGKGRAILTHADFTVVSRAAPAKPGEEVVFFLNSLGAVEPSLDAGTAPGDGSRDNPLNRTVAPVSALINNRPARVDYAGLVPYFPGLYQVNLLMPYDAVAGDIPVTFAEGDRSSQASITIPVEPNGFYWAITAGKFPNGQTMNGVSGPTSAFAFRHDNVEAWGSRGLDAWTKSTGMGSTFSTAAGLAITLRNAGTIVYDNNGIEDGTSANYYNNQGGGADDQKPGLWVLYSMSNYEDALWAGYVRLTQPTTFTQIIGYFDGNGEAELPFDPANVYNRYRVNIFSNGSDGLPSANAFAGDVFSSDSASGRFSFSDTGVRRVFQDGSADPIFRLVYTLDKPLTLPAGEYWFSHDCAVPAQPSAKAPSAAPGTTRRVPKSKMVQ